DRYGNTVTGYSGTVAFSSSDSAAILPGNSTLTKGSGTFTAAMETVGTQSLTATDTGNSSLTGTQSGIKVNAALAVIQEITPAQELTTGGVPVTIYGLHLSGATAVYFGTTAGTIQSDSDSSMVVVPPAHAAGTVDVTIVNAGGTSLITS